MQDKCAFIILSHNSGSFIGNCFDSVLSLTSVDPFIFVFDNGSEDDSVEVIMRYQNEYDGRVFLFKSDRNEGTTVSRNRLIREVYSSGIEPSYFCIIDSDTVINDDAVRLLKETLSGDPSISVATPRMFNGNDEEQMSVKRFPSLKIKFLKAMPFRNLEQKGKALEKYDFFPATSFIPGSRPPFATDCSVYDADYAISACWFLRKDFEKTYGFLDEKIFYAPEDVDFCATVKEKGGRVVLVSGASIYHLTQRISKRKLFSKMNFLHIKGLIYYSRKHGKAGKA